METIFVSVASYRDKLCSQTLKSIFDYAKYPERIFVGICQQNKENDPECIDPNFKYYKNVRIMRLDYQEAYGPTFARYLCSTLYQNETFFLQIDSHTLFVKDWDVKCIQMIESLEKSPSILNKKVLLSHYPPQMKYHSDEKQYSMVTHMVECFFNESGMISFKGAKWKRPGPLPRRNAFIAAGFIFCRGQWLKDVPFDPHLKNLFVGEEILLSARSYTSGWDVYTPNQNVVFHAYTRIDEPKFWNDNSYDDSEVKQKVKIILELERNLQNLKDGDIQKSIEKYNCGKIRSLNDFYNFIGVDVKSKTVGKPQIEFFTFEDEYLKKSNKTTHFCLLLVILILLILKN